MIKIEFNSEYCSCGNSFGTTMSTTACTNACEGNLDDICGGNSGSDVYKSVTVATANSIYNSIYEYKIDQFEYRNSIGKSIRNTNIFILNKYLSDYIYDIT